MKKKIAEKCKILFAALFAFMLGAAALTGCGGASDNSAAVAKVGDIEITENQMNAFTELMFFMNGYDFAALPDDEKDLYRADTLDTMIKAAAMEEYFKGKDVFPEDIADSIKQYTDMLYQTYGLKDTLEEKGVTEDTLKYYVETQYYFEALAEEATEGGVLPTEADTEAYYAAHEQEFQDVEERRISHILVGDAEHSDEDRQLAEDIRERIASGEESFEDMALEYGTDGTKDVGGDLDYNVREAYVPEFSDVAFALLRDELSGIVESEFGFHILKVTDIRNRRSLGAQRESIRNTLTYELYDNRAQELVDEYGAVYLSDKYPPPGGRAALNENGNAGDSGDAPAVEEENASE
jgi:parvulin-like peptidyl-prolyl isomerase